MSNWKNCALIDFLPWETSIKRQSDREPPIGTIYVCRTHSCNPFRKAEAISPIASEHSFCQKTMMDFVFSQQTTPALGSQTSTVVYAKMLAGMDVKQKSPQKSHSSKPNNNSKGDS